MAGTFSGKIQYFDWKLIGEREALVAYTLPTPKVWKREGPAFRLAANESAAVMPWPGKSKLFDQDRYLLAGRGLVADQSAPDQAPGVDCRGHGQRPLLRLWTPDSVDR